MAAYVCVLPFAIENEMATVLLGQRNLIVTREGGKTVKGFIPDWAGQWGLITSELKSGEGPEAAGERALREQASLDLSDPDVVTNFVLGNRRLVSLKTETMEPFYVLCIFTTSSALSLVNEAANSVILGHKTLSGTLSDTQTFAMDKARLKLGATQPPSGGWRDYLVTNYYGGKAPGQLNTEIDTLTSAITASAKQDFSFFSTALAASEN